MHENFITLAQKLINKNGRDVTLRTTTTTGGNDFDPTSGTTTIVDSVITCVFTKYSAKEIDGTNIQANDKKLLSYNEILETQKIVDDGIEYEIKNVDTIEPGTTKIIYIAQLRKGA